MRDETIVTDCYEFANEGVRLDPATVSNNDILLYFDEWTNKAARTHLASIQIDRFDDCHTFTEFRVNNSHASAHWLSIGFGHTLISKAICLF
jgi:hypothetical protein